MMKALVIMLLLASSFAPLAFAASDCEHTCCQSHNASWDNDFDDCLHPKGDYDTCVSQCDAKNAALWPVEPDQSKTVHYNCGTGAILFAVAGIAVLASGNGRRE
jgi:hypothetical protein